MYVSIHKQLIGFLNCFRVLSRLRQGKVKRQLLITKQKQATLHPVASNRMPAS